MNPLRIVILSGPIFPHNSPRSFRSTELAIGLAKKGHDVTLYSILGSYDYTEFENDTGVKVKGMGKSYFGNLNSDNKFLNDSKWFWFIKGSITRILYNIIDYPRVEYLFKAFKTLTHEKKIDYLITVAHPFGLHWGTALYKKVFRNSKFKVWVSDCGDPFMGDPDVNRINLFLKPLEFFWCKHTDFITIPIESGKTGYYKEFFDKIYVIPQGLNFSKVKLSVYKENEVPTFAYSGVVYPGMRDPSNFLEYLCTINQLFKFIVYSPNDDIFGSYIGRLGDKLEVKRYIPRYELISVLGTMDFIVNIKNNSEVQQPSKLIDYGLAKRPIIEISTSFNDVEKNVFNQFLKRDYRNQDLIPDLMQYDINNVCDKFLKLYGRKSTE